MNKPDFRALCAGLLKGLDENKHPEVRYPGDLRILMAEVRAALSQPAPEPPTDDEVATLIPWLLETAIHAADKGEGVVAGKLTLAAQLLGERWGQGNA